MSKPVITKQMLIDADACRNQVNRFEETFGDSVTVTVKRAEKVANLFNWDCVTRFLDAPASAEYQRGNALASAEYQRVIETASAERRRVTAIAWALAFIDMHRRGASK